MRFSTKEYFVKETYKSIRRNGFMSFASIFHGGGVPAGFGHVPDDFFEYQ